MAGEIPDLVAQERTGTGKGAARQARRDGMVPGIVFGGDKDPLPIQIPFNELFKRLKAGRFKSTLWNLKVDGHEDVRVICRDVQRDIVKDLPTHLDLMRLRRTTKIALFIPVEFINEDEAPGIKKGGVLTATRRRGVTVNQRKGRIGLTRAQHQGGDLFRNTLVTRLQTEVAGVRQGSVVAIIDVTYYRCQHLSLS